MKLFDTGVFIALFRTSDGYHKQAEELVRESKIVMTDFVFFETIEFLRRKFGSREAVKVGRKLLLEFDVEIIQTDMTQKTRAIDIMATYPGLSLYDALSVAVLEGFDEKIIVSFDHDFDLVKGITRIGD